MVEVADGRSILLAVQQGGGPKFVHEDPVTKSKRVTDLTGAVVSAVKMDPWGADTNRSSNAAFQPRRFTSYERDSNGSDEAMFRRYSRSQARFEQPDPYDGSYSLSDPQSLNRYAYVRNDPVNFTDPSGLEKKVPCFNADTQTWEECEDDGGPADERIEVWTWGLWDAEFNYRFALNSRFGGFSSDRSLGGRPQTSEPNLTKQSNQNNGISYADCFAKCCETNRLDNTIRDLGEAAGYPVVGEILADSTNTALAASVTNEVLNLSPFSRYPRQGVGGPAGSHTTWQHRAAQVFRRNVSGMSGTRWISTLAKGGGQLASKVAYPVIAFEAGHGVGTIGYCAARCANSENRRNP